MNRAMASAILLVAVLATLQLGEAIDCGQVGFNMAPCLGYLQSGGDAPPPQCCDAVHNLVELTPAQKDRQTACECLKAAAATFTVKAKVAADLPSRCGVSTCVPISLDVNCQSIN